MCGTGCFPGGRTIGLVAAAPSPHRSFVRDFSVSAVTAGFLAVLVSYSGPLLIFYQAAQSAQVSAEVFSSWVWGISIGAGVAGIVLSAWLRVPVVTAWSAPGTALLVTLFPAFPLAQAVGTGPRELTIRLDVDDEATRNEVQQEVESRVRDFLESHRVTDVTITCAAETPRQEPRSGKLRQVLRSLRFDTRAGGE